MHQTYDYGLWSMVFFNVLLFGAFAIGFLRPKRSYEWRTMGVFAAFIVALFTEMYGFPLTIYVLISLFGSQIGLVNPFEHINGHLLGSLFGAPESIKLIICLLGGLVMGIGLVIMGKGWRQIHEADGSLVTSGVYARMRHPQYAGLFLVTVGMLIQWPTLLTLAMWPILMIAYFRLSKREERAMLDRFGGEYEQYRNIVPAFFPRRGHNTGVLTERR